MKKNYISPLTENMQLAGGTTMADSLSIVTGSAAPKVTDAQEID